MFKSLGYTLIALLLTTSNGWSAAHCELIPKNWQPNLDPLKADMEQSLAQAKDQQAILSNSLHLADITDTQLFMVYIQLLQSLDSNQRATLVKEQQRWLQERSSHANAAVKSTDSSLATLEAANARKNLSEERLTQLLQRLQYLDSHCPQ